MAFSVAIVDDNEMWLRTLQDTISRFAEFEVSVTETVASEFTHRVHEHEPDVALIDLRMPPKSEEEGIALARSLRVDYPRMGIAVVSGLEDSLRHKYIEDKLSSASSGLAIGFLYKDRLTPDSLRRDLLRLAAGQTVVDSTIASDAIDAIVNARHSPLSATEEAFMRYVSEGWQYDKIAAAMSVSAPTVERLGRRTFDKLLGSSSSREDRRIRAIVEWLKIRREL